MRYKPQPRLSLKELRPIIEFYHSRFPSWSIARKDTLVRAADPVIQGITFERLSGGDYRPVGHIRVLVAPEEFWGFELPQHLNVRIRQINRRAHERLRERVLEVIREEFVPAIDRPLIAEGVLELYEHEAVPTSVQAYSLAPLNAYLGHEDRARYWCMRFDELVDSTGGPWRDFDQRRRAFLEQLEKWLKAGEAREQLERVLQDERRKWGLV